MAKLFENNYRTNPYVYGMVNVLSSFCRDYAEANSALEKNPDDTRCMMVRAYCVDFANYLSETTGLGYGNVGVAAPLRHIARRDTWPWRV